MITQRTLEQVCTVTPVDKNHISEVIHPIIDTVREISEMDVNERESSLLANLNFEV